MKKTNEMGTSKQLQQVKRLKFIDFLLGFRGWFTRQDLIEEFKVAPAGVTRDISEYKAQTSNHGEGETGSRNMEFDEKLKRYLISETYSPITDISFSHAINLLKKSGQLGYLGAQASIPIESPRKLHDFSVDTLQKISRSISNLLCVDIHYGSLGSGASKRRISPHSLFESNDKWYVRAYCHKSNEYRTFHLSRIEEIEIASQNTEQEHQSINDKQWQRWVHIILVPHPSEKHPESIAKEYGMKPYPPEEKTDLVDRDHTQLQLLEGESVPYAKEVKVRAAICGFWLNHWNVDCSENNHLWKTDKRYQLALANPQALYGVESARIAPGR
ncbi:MAG: WYL domain-containing protein [Oceanospirillaceae bacterium]|nr:WYL domain-containing protein [Oceanospirillaceae bacterium]